MKRTVSFKDANKVKFTIELTIEDGRFSMCGEGSGHMGQCDDSIKPKNDEQKKLLEAWKQYHLNDMNAGTPLQESVIKDCKDYDECVRKLLLTKADGTPVPEEAVEGILKAWNDLQAKEIDTTTLHGPDLATYNRMTPSEQDDFFYFNLIARYGGNEFVLLGKSELSLKERAEKFFFNQTLLFDNGYRYGSSWLKRDLPEDIEDDMDELFDAIEEIEESEKEGGLASEMDDQDILDYIIEHEDELPTWATHATAEDDDVKTAIGLAKICGLSMNELDEIDNDEDNRWTVQGTDYLAGNDSAMDDEWDKELENYIDECILPEVNESCRQYFDNEKWKDDAKHDGRGHSLNRYDGSEDEAEVFGETIYAYQQ